MTLNMSRSRTSFFPDLLSAPEHEVTSTMQPTRTLTVEVQRESEGGAHRHICSFLPLALFPHLSENMVSLYEKEKAAQWTLPCLLSDSSRVNRLGQGILGHFNPVLDRAGISNTLMSPNSPLS